MTEFRCSKVCAGACGECEGSHRERTMCPEWNTSEEIANALRAMLSHIKNSNLQAVMK